VVFRPDFGSFKWRLCVAFEREEKECEQETQTQCRKQKLQIMRLGIYTLNKQEQKGEYKFFEVKYE